VADSRRSGDEIHPWLPNGDLATPFGHSSLGGEWLVVADSVEKLAPPADTSESQKCWRGEAPHIVFRGIKSPKQRTLRAVGDWKNCLRFDCPSFLKE